MPRPKRRAKAGPGAGRAASKRARAAPDSEPEGDAAAEAGTPPPTPPAPAPAAGGEEVAELAEHIRGVQGVLRRRLSGVPCAAEDPWLTLEGRHGKSIRQLAHFLVSFAASGKGESVLVLGHKGSGKSTVVNAAIDAALQDEAVVQQGGLVVVRLFGSIHGEDAAAKRETARQLMLTGVCTFDDGDGQPMELDASAVPLRDREIGSVADAGSAVVEAFLSGDQRTARSLVFVLEGFDGFVRGKQRFLYTLVNAAIAGHTPMAVIGVTSRLDAMTHLEKRIFSRFNKNAVQVDHVAGFEEYTRCVREVLTPPPGLLPAPAQRVWAEHLDALCTSGSTLRELRRWFDISVSLQAAHRLLQLPVARLSPARPLLAFEDVYRASLAQRMDTQAGLLLGASVLEVALVVAMFVCSGNGADRFNFEMAYAAYLRFTRNARYHYHESYSAATAFKAYEHLIAMDAIRALGGQRKKAPRRFRKMILLVHASELRQVLDRYAELPQSIRQWGKDSLKAF